MPTRSNNHRNTPRDGKRYPAARQDAPSARRYPVTREGSSGAQGRRSSQEPRRQGLQGAASRSRPALRGAPAQGRATGTGGRAQSPRGGASYARQPSGSYSRGARPAGRAPVKAKTSGRGGPQRGGMPPKKRNMWIRRCIFFAAVLGVLIFWSTRYYQPILVPGVHINGIDMSGKTRDEAITLLEQQMETMKDSIAVTLKYEDRSWVLTKQDFDVDAPIEYTVDQAMLVAREGNVFKRMLDGWEARRNKPNYQASLGVEDANLTEKIAQIAAELDVPATNATINFDPNEVEFTITEGSQGRVLDQESLRETIMQALEKELSCTIELTMQTTEPEITKAQLSQATDRISFFETEVNGSANRIDNVKLALAQFNGLTIAPGQTVSFNETTGERSADNGYKEAPGINADKGLEDTLGGGVCQASTTLYNAALMANCKIEERHRHSFPSSYVKKGFDAMVNWPNSDFKFTNQSDYPLFIRTYVGEKDGKVYAQVWFYGKKLENGITLQRQSVIVEETEKPEPELIEDTSGKYADYVTYDDEAYVAVSSRAGMVVEAYLITKDADGNEIDKKLLYTDHFPAITGKHYYGTEKRPAGERPKAKAGCYLLPHATYVPLDTPKPTSTPRPDPTPEPDAGEPDTPNEE